MISEGGATTRAVEVGTTVVGVVLCFLVGDGLLVDEETLGLASWVGCVSRAGSDCEEVGASVAVVVLTESESESQSGLQMDPTEDGGADGRGFCRACAFVAQTA